MKRVFNFGKKSEAFSMAEMLVVMLILAVVIIAMSPVAVKRIKKGSVNPEHGSFECYYDENNQLLQIERNAQGEMKELLPTNRTEQGFCEFSPGRGAMFFTVNAVGGGSPGTGISSVFNNLPAAPGLAQNATNAGVDFLTSFRKYRSVLLRGANGETVKYDDLTYGSLDTDSPVKWLNDEGIQLYAMLVSDGGELTDSSKAGYIIETLNSKSSVCNYDPPGFDSYETSYNTCNSFSVSGGTGTRCEYLSKHKVNVGSIWSPVYESCFKMTIYSGKNPLSGGYVSFLATVPNGSTIYADKSQSPGFGVGSVGCRVPRGATGCFGACPQPTAQSSDYSSAMKCKSDSIKFSNSTGGYSRKNYTVSDAKTFPSKVHVISGNHCIYDVSSNTFEATSGSSCPPSWDIVDEASTETNKWYVNTYGNLALVWRELSRGLNFYAKGGNPGQYRTLYIPRFAQNVIITPGRPIRAVDNSVVGNDTVLAYRDGTRIMTARGGQRPIANTETASTTDTSTTFIMGNLFDLAPNPGHVIAYDTTNGVQHQDLGEIGEDDSSGDEGEYGSYFLPRLSGFMYPIPDAAHAIPETVGRGGHGAYTIYRRSGKTDAYSMRKFSPTPSSGFTSKNSAGSEGVLSPASYTCKNEREGATLTGSSTDAHRCFAGDGKGGAVVITW